MKTEIVLINNAELKVDYKSPYKQINITTPCTTYIIHEYDRKWLWKSLPDVYYIEQNYRSSFKMDDNKWKLNRSERIDVSNIIEDLALEEYNKALKELYKIKHAKS